MQRKRTSAIVKVAGLVLIVLIFAGCTDNLERVPVAPTAPMDGINRIAIVGIENYTGDPSLGLHFEQALASILRESGLYEVVDSARSRATMARLNVTLAQVADPSIAAQLAEELEVDALITGLADYYFEDIHLSAPRCTRCNVQDRTPAWTVTQTTTVIATFEAQIIGAERGEIIWVNMVRGEDSTRRTVDVSWYESSAPPSSLLPHPNRADIPVTREAAIREAARNFTTDLLPRFAWVRKD